MPCESSSLEWKSQGSSPYPSQPPEVVEARMVDLDPVTAAQDLSEGEASGMSRALAAESMMHRPHRQELVVVVDAEAIAEEDRITGADIREHHPRYPLK
jgi:hypothetical protein